MAATQTPNKSTNSRQAAAAQTMEDPIEVGRDLVQYAREYVRENPETAAVWCFGIGFLLGWKLKIW